MRIESDPKLDFSDVLLRPKRSTLGSRSEVELERTYKFLHSDYEFRGIPIIASNMDTIGTLEMAKVLNKHNLSCALHKHYRAKDFINYFNDDQFNFYSMGIVLRDHSKFRNTSSITNVPRVCVDVANGYSENFIKYVRELRNTYPEIIIMAGNVVTPEVTEQLILAGADIVKVGIGSGSVCTTRKMTGVGYPQLSAVIECADAAHGLGGHICSDGGCAVPGDVAKAFAAGADFVMLGGMLAGHDECGGEVCDEMGDKVGRVGDMRHIKLEGTEDLWLPSQSQPDKLFMKFYGMSSEEAHNKHSGGVADYRTAEGKSVLIPYRGKVENTIKEILGGLRSACTYVGARKLKELSKRSTFVLVHNQFNTIYGE